MKAINAKRLSKLVRDLGRAPSVASAQIARELNKEIQSNFTRGVDPFGRKWRGLAQSTKEAGRHNPPLTDSGHGRSSVVVKALRGAGVAIVVGALYMIYHQFGGASHLRGPGGSYSKRHKNKAFGRDADRSKGREHPPRRSFLPQGNQFPPRWVAIIERAYKAATTKAWRNG